MNYAGTTKLIKKYLGFLETEYDFKFTFQTFHEYYGFRGPIDTYSFYNQYGCFTLHHVVQKGEWSWYTSKSFSKDQYQLLKTEINQGGYISGRCWFYSTVLKKLSNIIKTHINCYNSFFGIKVINREDE